MTLKQFKMLGKDEQSEMVAYLEFERERKEELRKNLNAEDPTYMLSQVMLLLDG